MKTYGKTFRSVKSARIWAEEYTLKIVELSDLEDLGIWAVFEETSKNANEKE